MWREESGQWVSGWRDDSGEKGPGRWERKSESTGSNNKILRELKIFDRWTKIWSPIKNPVYYNESKSLSNHQTPASEEEVYKRGVPNWLGEVVENDPVDLLWYSPSVIWSMTHILSRSVRTGSEDLKSHITPFTCNYQRDFLYSPVHPFRTFPYITLLGRTPLRELG